MAWVSGYWTPGDGGGGLFRWQPWATDSPDDGLVLAPDPKLPGRWFRERGGILDARWFGIPADGTRAAAGSSNRDRFQQILNLAQANTEVVVPPGRYLIDGELTITGARSLVIHGHGDASVLAFQAKDAAILAVGVETLVIADLTIEGSFARGVVVGDLGRQSRDVSLQRCTISGATNPAGQPTAGVHLLGVDVGRIEDCKFLRIGSDACGSNASLCVHVVSCRAMSIARNRCDARQATMGIGLSDVVQSTVNANVVEGAHVRSDLGAWGYGIYFYRTEHGDVSDNSCIDNVVRGTDGTGIYLQGATRTLVRANVVEDTCRKVAGVTLATGAIALNATATDCRVERNRIAGTGNPSLPCAGIRFDSPRTVVRGNDVHATSGDGILLNGDPSGSTIEGNRVAESMQAGITSRSLAGGHDIVIRDNTVLSTGSRAPGIAIQGGSTADLQRVLILGNVVQHASGAGISLGHARDFQVAHNAVSHASEGADGYASLYIADCSEGAVSNNIADSAAPVMPVYGIHVAGGSLLSIVNNRVRARLEQIHMASTSDITVSENY